MVRLRLMLNGVTIREAPMDKAVLTLGRHPDNDVVIDNPAVSAHHCRITREGGGHFIEDLGSTNGTTLNEQPVKKSGLRANDVIGVTLYDVHFLADDPAAGTLGEKAGAGGPDGPAKTGRWSWGGLVRAVLRRNPEAADSWSLILRELGVLLAVATVIGYATTRHNPFWTGVALHPYLLVAVLMAARYGTGGGLVSAAALTLAYEAGGFARAWAPGPPPLLDLPHSGLVAGLFLFAFTVGHLFDAYRLKLEGFKAAAMEASARFTVIESHNKAIEGANRELRSRILEDTTTFQSIYEMAKKLSALEPRFLYPAVLEILERHLKAQKCSFYLVEGATLRLAAQRGWEEVPDRAKRVAVSEGMLGVVAREGRMVTLKDLAYQDQLEAGDKVMAAPVRALNDGKVIGVIAVEKLPFQEFNPANVRTFALIAEWAAKSLSNAALFISAGSPGEDLRSLVSELMARLEDRTIPSDVLRQLVGMGERILPELGAELLKPGLTLSKRSNLLSVLEHLQREGYGLSEEVCRAATLEALRGWCLLERYRLAAEKALGPAGELLAAYLSERQGQLREQAGRSLALDLAARPGASSPSAPLFKAIAAADLRLVERLAKETFGYAAAPFEEIAGEILSSPDRGLRATTFHAIGLAGARRWRCAVSRGLSDENSLVRETCLLALVRLGEDPDEPLGTTLSQRAADDPDPHIRRFAHDLLMEKEAGQTLSRPS